MIKAIIFDYGGVVTPKTKSLILKDISESCKLPISVVKKTIKELIVDFQTGKIDSEFFWLEFKKRTNTTLPPEYKSLWIRKYKEEFRRDPDILKIIKRLKEKGYLVPLLSNTIEPHAKFNRQNNNLDLFDPVILSNEVGLRKPDKRIYLLVLEKIDCLPEQCIYIGDRADFLEPAENLGMHVIHYQNSSHLLR